MKIILFILFTMTCLPGRSLSPVSVGKASNPDTLCLGGNSGYFSFGLSSLASGALPSEIVYQWTLKGHDKKWHTSGKGSRIHYAGLHPGNYLLSVRAFSRTYRKYLFRRDLLVIVHPNPETGKGVLYLYLFLLLLIVASVYIHAFIFRKRMAKDLSVLKKDAAFKELFYTPADLAFVERVDRIIKAHCCEKDFLMDHLYKEIGMSRSSFNNKWKALGKEAPHLYVCRARLEKAKILLVTTSLPMSEIAVKCGFCDAKYFREVFKKEFSMAPTEYRKTQSVRQDSEEA